MVLEYFSEYGQDIFLDHKLFGFKENGIFIEVGASDGLNLSNSYFFEKYRNWKGICIEPRLSVFKDLQKNRSCYCENYCISKSGKPEKFVEFTGDWLPLLSGIERNFYNPHKMVIEDGMNNHQYNHQKLEYELNSISLQLLIEKYQLKEIDYCSIDTEGSELEVLETIDFNKTMINVFSIENNYNNLEINDFMASKGYSLVKEIGVPSVALDQIYKRK
jgi:FkbM family methyltransferase